MSFGGEYAFFKEDSACSTFGDSDTVIFSKEFGKMTDIRIKILVFIKQGYLLSDVVRSGMGRGSAFVAMGKGCFSALTICFDEPVDSASCASELYRSSVLVAVGIYQFLDHFVFFLFIHC